MKTVKGKMIAVVAVSQRIGAFMANHFTSEATVELGANRLLNNFTVRLVLFTKTFLTRNK